MASGAFSELQIECSSTGLSDIYICYICACRSFQRFVQGLHSQSDWTLRSSWSSFVLHAVPFEVCAYHVYYIYRIWFAGLWRNVCNEANASGGVVVGCGGIASCLGWHRSLAGSSRTKSRSYLLRLQHHRFIPTMKPTPEIQCCVESWRHAHCSHCEVRWSSWEWLWLDELIDQMSLSQSQVISRNALDIHEPDDDMMMSRDWLKRIWFIAACVWVCTASHMVLY